jgi:hypothetical protein
MPTKSAAMAMNSTTASLYSSNFEDSTPDLLPEGLEMCNCTVCQKDDKSAEDTSDSSDDTWSVDTSETPICEQSTESTRVGYDFLVRLAFILVQFGAMHFCPRVLEDKGSVLTNSLLIFEVTTLVCRTSTLTSSILWLVPEIIMDCMLSLVAKGKLKATSRVVTRGSIVLAVTVCALCVYEMKDNKRRVKRNDSKQE